MLLSLTLSIFLILSMDISFLTVCVCDVYGWIGKEPHTTTANDKRQKEMNALACDSMFMCGYCVCFKCNGY